MLPVIIVTVIIINYPSQRIIFFSSESPPPIQTSCPYPLHPDMAIYAPVNISPATLSL